MRRYVALLAAAVNIVFIVHRPGNFSRFDFFSALKSLKKKHKNYARDLYCCLQRAFFSSSSTVDGIFVYDFHRSLFGYDFYYFVSCLLLIYGINEIHS